MANNKAWVAPRLDARVLINASHPLELLAFRNAQVVIGFQENQRKQEIKM